MSAGKSISTLCKPVSAVELTAASAALYNLTRSVELNASPRMPSAVYNGADARILNVRLTSNVMNKTGGR